MLTMRIGNSDTNQRLAFHPANIRKKISDCLIADGVRHNDVGWGDSPLQTGPLLRGENFALHQSSQVQELWTALRETSFFSATSPQRAQKDQCRIFWFIWWGPVRRVPL